MRTSVNRAVAVAAAALIAGWPGDAVPRAHSPAELVLVNGKVITVDPADAIAQAVAISRWPDRPALGSTADVRVRTVLVTQVFDLGGLVATLASSTPTFISPRSI